MNNAFSEFCHLCGIGAVIQAVYMGVAVLFGTTLPVQPPVAFLDTLALSVASFLRTCSCHGCASAG